MSAAVAARAQARSARPALSPLAARTVAFVALAAFGEAHWMAMVEPTATGRALAAVAVAVATGLALRAAPARGLRPAVVLAGLLGALLAGGVAAGRLWPGRWGELATALVDGLDAIAGARIPYGGLDPDLRMVLQVGGALLVLASALLAFWPRADGAVGLRLPALVALVSLYSVPAIALDLDGEFLRGALLSALVLAFLALERVAVSELKGAGMLMGVAAVLALALAPALDTRRPWFDYEEFAQGNVTARAESFSWNHDYGALAWPRDGRELLRVASPQRAYWKADTLDHFDGRRWLADPAAGAPPPASTETLGVSGARRRRWTFPIEVTVRNLRSDTLPLAGATEGLVMTGRQPAMIRAGVWSAGDPITRGDSYRARVYVPQPSAAELRAAKPDYPISVLEDLSFDAAGIPGVGTDPRELLVRGFKQAPQVVGYGARRAAADLRESDLGGVYALSRRLLATSATPYDYVRAVERRLGNGYRYDETPPPAAAGLPGFLLDAKAGFCQQFSGSMALLLRMGGVPARVATGFAPGSLDKGSDRYVVRDLDAHSWVEAWFGGIGWVVFDPTPAAAPPRSQADSGAASAGRGDVRDLGTIRGALPDAPAPTPGPPVGRWIGGLLGILALLGAVRALWVRRNAPRLPPVSELERALRCAGEAVGPQTTLAGLETRFGSGSPTAAYVRALRAQRYTAASAQGPTAAQRRGLRRELSRGRGLWRGGRTWLVLRPRRRRAPR